MRVQPGQIAYITRAPGFPIVIGAVVKVIERADDMDGMPSWAVEVGSRLIVTSKKTGRTIRRVKVPDAYLTPIAEIGVHE